MKKLLVVALMMLPVPLWAEDGGVASWKLDAEQSQLSFVSIKKENVAETHHFTHISGGIEGDHAVLTIDLSSVETGVPIRNERMQKHLFDVTSFAEAVARVDVDPSWLSLGCGEVKQVKADVVLDLHGVSQTLPAALTVMAGNDGVWVSTSAPLLLKAGDFGLDAGIEQLRTLAKLPSIARAVPVSVQLHFVRSHDD